MKTRGSPIRRSRLALAIWFALLVSGCTFSYIPPIPQPHQPAARVALASGELRVDEERLTLTVSLDQVARSGWLAVQWFDPRNREVASDAVWLEAAPEGFSHCFELPPGADLSPGRWRAVASFEGEVLRQFATEVE